ISRGDKIVTGGGIMGTVTKVDDDNQVTVEIAKDIKVKVRRELISAVQNKNAPVAANDAGSKPSGGLLSGLFGGGSKPVAEAEPEKPATKAKPATKVKPASKKKSASKEKPAVEEKPVPAEDDKK
ncbi:MAG: preprotein translocase subunit YajC, partial [Rhodospirillales bacterium]